MTYKEQVMVSRLMRRGEAAKVLDVHINTVDRLIKDGELQAVKIGGRVMIEASAINDLIKRSRT